MKDRKTSVFNNGMNLDFHPMQAQDGTYVSALNATLISKDGNEMVLKNEMGNARVETAFLPEGYIPLGMAELGGVVYVVSYNPMTHKGQVGSFPSPERNISKSEVTDNEVSISSDDFGFNENDGAKIYYLKKELNQDLIFSPGDKFIVYSDKIKENYENIYNKKDYKDKNIDRIKNHTIKIELGTVTDSGRLVKFSDLKKYKIDGEGHKHFIYPMESKESLTTDIDEYRNLVSQPYNIFDSNVSGRLVLICELVKFDSFGVSWSNKFDKNGSDSKTFNPSLSLTMNGIDEFIPKGAHFKLEMFKGAESIGKDEFSLDFDSIETKTEDYKSYNYDIKSILNTGKANNIKSNIDQLSQNKYFDKENREPYSIRYEITPEMNWGKIGVLTKIGTIDLDKIGTGLIKLDTWKYYVEPRRTLSLTWGLTAYEEDGKSIKSIKMTFNRLNDENKKVSYEYIVPKKSKYSGKFQELFEFEKSELIPNTLYLVEVKIDYSIDDGSSTEEPIIFYRWLYTNQIFNDKYINTEDFNELKLKLDIDISNKVDYFKVRNTGGYKKMPSIITKNNEINTIDDIDEEDKIAIITDNSVIRTRVLADLVVKNGYDTFFINDNKNVEMIINEDPKLIHEYEYLGLDDEYKDKTSVVTWMPSYEELETDGISYYVHRVQRNLHGSKFLNIAYLAAHNSIGHADFSESKYMIRGSYRPLAYNDSTFYDYGLRYDKDLNRFLPSKLGFMSTWDPVRSGFKKPRGGFNVGIQNSEIESDYINEETGPRWEGVALNFGPDGGLLNEYMSKLFSGQAIFVTWHHKDVWGVPNDYVEYLSYLVNNKYIKSESDLNRIDNYWGGTVGDHKIIGLMNDETQIIFLLLKADDNLYYPISFSSSKKVSEADYKHPGTYFKDETFKYLFYDFACFLSNIYKYDDKEESLTVFSPNNITYQDNDVYKIIESIKFSTGPDGGELNDSITINVGGEKKIPFFKYVSDLKNGIDDKKINMSNVSDSIKNINKKEDVEFSYKIKNRNFDKKNFSINENNKDYIVYDYDGNAISFLYGNPGDIQKLYIRVSDSDIKEYNLNNYNGKLLKFDYKKNENGFNVTPNSKTYKSSKVNGSNVGRLKVKDGLLTFDASASLPFFLNAKDIKDDDYYHNKVNGVRPIHLIPDRVLYPYTHPDFDINNYKTL